MAKGRKPAKGGPRLPRDEEDSDDSASEEEKRPAERTVGKQRSNVGMMPPSDSESGSDEEEGEGEPKPAVPKHKTPHGGQPATAGMLPPSDSDDEDEEDEEDDEEEGAPAVRCATQSPLAPTKRLPRTPRSLRRCQPFVRCRRPQDCAQLVLCRAAAARTGLNAESTLRACSEKRAAAPPVEKSPAEIAAELAKLELVRKRRCARRVARSFTAALLRRRSAHRLLPHRADQAAQRIASEGFDRFAPR